MHKSLYVIAIGALALVGCGSGASLPRGAVSGQVTVAGQPLAGGRVLFVPQAPTAGPTATARVINGRYELPESHGPIVGTHRVQVEADLPLGFAIDDEAAFAARGIQALPPNPIPPAFNSQSQLTTAIAADTPNTFDITIPSAGR